MWEKCGKSVKNVKKCEKVWNANVMQKWNQNSHRITSHYYRNFFFAFSHFFASHSHCTTISSVHQITADIAWSRKSPPQAKFALKATPRIWGLEMNQLIWLFRDRGGSFCPFFSNLDSMKIHSEVRSRIKLRDNLIVRLGRAIRLSGSSCT